MYLSYLLVSGNCYNHIVVQQLYLNIQTNSHPLYTLCCSWEVYPCNFHKVFVNSRSAKKSKFKYIKINQWKRFFEMNTIRNIINVIELLSFLCEISYIKMIFLSAYCGNGYIAFPYTICNSLNSWNYCDVFIIVKNETGS